MNISTTTDSVKLNKLGIISEYTIRFYIGVGSNRYSADIKLFEKYSSAYMKTDLERMGIDTDKISSFVFVCRNIL